MFQLSRPIKTTPSPGTMHSPNSPYPQIFTSPFSASPPLMKSLMNPEKGIAEQRSAEEFEKMIKEGSKVEEIELWMQKDEKNFIGRERQVLMKINLVLVQGWKRKDQEIKSLEKELMILKANQKSAKENTTPAHTPHFPPLPRPHSSHSHSQSHSQSGDSYKIQRLEEENSYLRNNLFELTQTCKSQKEKIINFQSLQQKMQGREEHTRKRMIDLQRKVKELLNESKDVELMLQSRMSDKNAKKEESKISANDSQQNTQIELRFLRKQLQELQIQFLSQQQEDQTQHGRTSLQQAYQALQNNLQIKLAELKECHQFIAQLKEDLTSIDKIDELNLQIQSKNLKIEVLSARLRIQQVGTAYNLNPSAKTQSTQTDQQNNSDKLERLIQLQRERRQLFDEAVN